jgi:hypothetical protein
MEPADATSPALGVLIFAIGGVRAMWETSDAQRCLRRPHPYEFARLLFTATWHPVLEGPTIPGCAGTPPQWPARTYRL